MTKQNFIFFLLVLMTNAAFAQQKTPRVIHAQWRTERDSVQETPEQNEMEIVQGEYDTIYKEILISPAYHEGAEFSYRTIVKPVSNRPMTQLVIDEMLPEPRFRTVRRAYSDFVILKNNKITKVVVPKEDTLFFYGYKKFIWRCAPASAEYCSESMQIPIIIKDGPDTAKFYLEKFYKYYRLKERKPPYARATGRKISAEYKYYYRQVLVAEARVVWE